MKTMTPPKKRSRKPHHYSLPVEVSGTCSVCHDLFTIYVFYTRGQYQVQETPRVCYVERLTQTAAGEVKQRVLVHRPDVCNGVITLYGSPEQFSSQTTQSHLVTGAGSASASR